MTFDIVPDIQARPSEELRAHGRYYGRYAVSEKALTHGRG
jgi:hypothetical protein